MSSVEHYACTCHREHRARKTPVGSDDPNVTTRVYLTEGGTTLPTCVSFQINTLGVVNPSIDAIPNSRSADRGLG